ncbi:hypothetical protein Dimus_028634 [Dionaea muscipula]
MMLDSVWWAGWCWAQLVCAAGVWLAMVLVSLWNAGFLGFLGAIFCGRPAALRERTSESDDDNNQDRDFHVATIGNNLIKPGIFTAMIWMRCFIVLISAFCRSSIPNYQCIDLYMKATLVLYVNNLVYFCYH